jgi:hypothetical protein
MITLTLDLANGGVFSLPFFSLDYNFQLNRIFELLTSLIAPSRTSRIPEDLAGILTRQLRVLFLAVSSMHLYVFPQSLISPSNGCASLSTDYPSVFFPLPFSLSHPMLSFQ